MAFAPISPLTMEGLPKFLSLTYHELISWAVYAFAELGIADQLIHAPSNHGFTAQEIIGDDRPKWNSGLLNRILRTCSHADLVKSINDEKHFVLTESGVMMTSDHPSRVRDHIRWSFGPIFTGACLQLPDIVRGEGTGTGVARITGGVDFYTLMGQSDQKDLLSMFSGSMTTFSTQTGSRLVRGVDFSRFPTIVDLGGSRGTLLAQLLENYPQIQQGTVFDLPHIVDQYKEGEEFKSRHIQQDRWNYVPGDLFDASTIPLADAYVLKHILHDFNDERCVEILSSIRKANEHRKGSSITVFIIEHIILPDGALSNWQSHGFDIGMAVLFDNAHERTQDEYEELLKKSGFAMKQLYPIQAPNSIVEAVINY